MPRFVVHHHQTAASSDRPEHWDLMLEKSNKKENDPEQKNLETWALECPLQTGQVIKATKIADHRHVYLEKEGELSGGRGTTSRMESGTFEWITNTSCLRVFSLTQSGECRSVTLTQIRDEEFEVEMFDVVDDNG